MSADNIPLGPVPDGWGADALSKYLDDCRRNQLASFQQRPGSYARLRDLDALFLKLASNLDNTVETVPALFFFRAHATFRAAVGLVLAGQVVEAYPLLRNGLEQALYAYFIYRNPSRWDTWQARHDSPEALKKAKALFKIGDMIRELTFAEPEDGRVTANLYQWTIDWGAHPNAFGVIQGVEMTEDAEALHVLTKYLHPGTPEHAAVLKETCRVGVAILGIFGHVFDPRFTILGLWDDLRPVKKGL